ncbi:MAG: hypothetical protein OQK95_13895 [Gammaproteobacteria bacterium]|nr:hypothetical protein [Gammaproteobacteria bacterium]
MMINKFRDRLVINNQLKLYTYVLGIALSLFVDSAFANEPTEKDMIRCKEVITVDWLIKENPGYNQENVEFMCKNVSEGAWLTCIEGQKNTGQSFPDALKICADIEN